MIKTTCRQDTTKWHKWFAWRPVQTNWQSKGDRWCWKTYWLLTIERKQQDDYGGSSWEYREIGDV